MRQVWKKIGLVHANDNPEFTHAAVPLAIPRGKGRFTIFFTTRDKQNKSVPFSLEFDIGTLKVVTKGVSPILLPGSSGEFDEDGVMPTSWIRASDKIFLFYIGWNRGKGVPFRNSIGLAISKDDGNSFHKVFQGPILDRSIHDPCFVASCDVLQDENQFRMWYLSGLKWEFQENQWKHYYHIKYATSSNLVDWNRTGQVAIDFNHPNEYAISTPRVIKDESGMYKMWYSHRAGANYQTYRIGYAESRDGINWIRRDNEVDMSPSSSGWDSEMICYPFIFEYGNDLFMLYNGNDFGRTGFGLAMLSQ